MLPERMRNLYFLLSEILLKVGFGQIVYTLNGGDVILSRPMSLDKDDHGSRIENTAKKDILWTGLTWTFCLLIFSAVFGENNFRS